LDGAQAGQRTDIQGLEFGEDGIGPDQAVPAGRRGVGLESLADGEDGAVQLGRTALGDVVVGRGEVVETLGTRLQVAAPPLVEPELGAAQRVADVLDRAAAESESNGTLACREFVLHGYLLVAAARGCPRRELLPDRGGGADSCCARRACNRHTPVRCTGGFPRPTP